MGLVKVSKLIIRIKGKPKRLQLMREALDDFIKEMNKKEKLPIKKMYYPSEYVFTVEGNIETIDKLRKEQKIKTSHKLAMKIVGIKIKIEVVK